jgi:hypothetical protein
MSVRCGYCYRYGHNQTSCEKKTSDYKAAHDRDVANGMDDSYAISRYKKHIGPRSKKVKCGYCKEPGHTRRTCEVLKADLKWYVSYHNAILKITEEYLNSAPVGVGSLFQQNTEEYNYNKGCYEKKSYRRILTGFSLVNCLDGRITVHYQTDVVGRGPSADKSFELLMLYGSTRGYPRQLLASRCNHGVDSDWVTKNSITIEQVNKTDLFRDRDGRNWALTRTREWATRPFMSEEEYANTGAAAYTTYERWMQDWKRNSLEGIRENLFKQLGKFDFDSAIERRRKKKLEEVT